MTPTDPRARGHYRQQLGTGGGLQQRREIRVSGIGTVYLLAAVETGEGLQRRSHQFREILTERLFEVYGFDFESCLRAEFDDATALEGCDYVTPLPR